MARVPIRVLLVRSWTEPLAPIRAALHDAGLYARVIRVDFEAALNAVLARERLDVIVFDETQSTLDRRVVELRLREHRCSAPIISFESIDQLVADIARMVESHRN